MATTASTPVQTLWRLPSVLSGSKRRDSIMSADKKTSGGIAKSIQKKWMSISSLSPAATPAVLTCPSSGNAPLSAPTSPSVISTRVRMLSPKMQRSIRINENQVLMLADKAKNDQSYSGYLCKRSLDSNRWQKRWFTLYQNLLFYSESNTNPKPSGVIMLEGCYCERLITTNLGKTKDDKQHCFSITYRRENQRQYDLRAETDSLCKKWIDMIRQASFNKLLLQKEELEHKHLHLLHIVESEKTAKFQYTQQCEELTSEIKKLRGELCALKKEWRVIPSRRLEDLPEDSEEIKKIKKVQSFFRGWLCRRRWKQIVEEYIRSPHAESMRKRNSLVFRMVEAEEEYVEQLNMLITYFLRPFKMAASSKKPPCNHEDVNAIFLNSETLLFLHQIFLKGLSARMESWPTLVLDSCQDGNNTSTKQKKTLSTTTIQLLGNTNLGDLFDMLLPMLSIYQEYVRNHHYSLQVVAECKQSSHFASFLNRLESRPALQGRTLETFLTYPMHQIPRYIITLHELLAHTPHNHVERRSLDHARVQLEDLSRQMHDEVSETENIRKSLAIERMIIEGCDILLDVNQMFVRQGSLIQIQDSKARFQKSRLVQFKSEKETVRQCFLFSNHLIVTTRTSGGKLHLVPTVGKISLQEATLIEDPNEGNNQDDDGESSVCSISSENSGVSDNSAASSSDSSQGNRNAVLAQQTNPLFNLDFKIIVEQKSGDPIILHLVAPTMQEKQAWISDISQCLDNVHFNNLFRSSISDTSSVTMPHCIKNDPRLFRDDIDIRFSRTLNSCKVPHIRYATPDRLLERLTDLRFLSIDFLNTFLLTYRVFSDGVTVLEALKKVFYNPDLHDQNSDSSADRSPEYVSSPPPDIEIGMQSPRRISTISAFSAQSASHQSQTTQPPTQKYQQLRFQDGFESCSKSKSEPGMQLPSIIKSPSTEGKRNKCTRCGYMSPKTVEEEQKTAEKALNEDGLSSGPYPLSPAAEEDENNPESSQDGDLELPAITIPMALVSKNLEEKKLSVNDSGETLQNEETIKSPPTSPRQKTNEEICSETKDRKLQIERPSRPRRFSYQPLECPTSPPKSFGGSRKSLPRRMSSLDERLHSQWTKFEGVTSEADDDHDSGSNSRRRLSGRAPSCTSAYSGSHLFVGAYGRKRISFESELAFSLGGLSSPRSSVHTATPRSSFQVPDATQQPGSKVGVVVTGSTRQASRRSSSVSALAAFAAATAASSNPRELPNTPPGRSLSTDARRPSFKERPRQESIISTAATMRVLNVLRHWVSKHWQDFESDCRLRTMAMEFLEDLICCPTLLPGEHKAASQLLRLIGDDEPSSTKINLDALLAAPSTPSKESIETLSAMDIAEQMTYIDHQIFVSIRSEEFLKTAWTRPDKSLRARHIILITKRFNEMSRLVVSEIVRRGAGYPTRVSVIEKWVAVADICRVLHNFNGVLQVCSAFQNSSVFRLKKTWEKISKTTRQTMEKLQTLVSGDGRFRSLRDALHRCDPPCIPYLGMYLADLSFIEEGTPNFTEDELLNFSKMRMIAHVIREVRHFQQTPYKIENIPRVCSYLLDESLLLTDDDLYRLSLNIEPRRSTLAHISVPNSLTSTPTTTSS